MDTSDPNYKPWAAPSVLNREITDAGLDQLIETGMNIHKTGESPMVGALELVARLAIELKAYRTDSEIRQETLGETAFRCTHGHRFCWHGHCSRMCNECSAHQPHP